MTTEDLKTFDVLPEAAGKQLRLFIGDSLPLEPEDFLHTLITKGKVGIDGEVSDPTRVVRAGQKITIEGLEEARKKFKATVVRAPVVYEDEHILIMNKPAGCTVVRERHADDCPFQNGVLAYLRESAGSRQGAINFRPRAVHRLDRDTTGAVIIAKTREGELHLSRQFNERTVTKEYLAVVHGEMPDDSGTIEAPIDAREHGIERVTVSERYGRPAETAYNVAERFRGFTLVRASPKTGRRHQIRIHLAHVGFPIAGDKVYGGGESVLLSSFKRGYRRKGNVEEKPIIARPALHAAAITFVPVGETAPKRIEAPLPHDIEVFLKMLRKYAIGGGRRQWESDEEYG